MTATMFDHCSFTHQFKLNYEETRNVAIGHSVSSGDISAGGHLWRINCYPHGIDKKENTTGDYISVFLELVSKSKDVKAILEAFVMDRDGALSQTYNKRCVQIFPPKGGGNDWGWPRFVERSVLDPLYLTNGSIIIMCGVKVVCDPYQGKKVDCDSFPKRKVVCDQSVSSLGPPSDIGSQLGVLLDSTDGSDVSFIVDGEKFPAHRAVLAARSPVFKAQLFGSMADAKMSSITLLDITPETFKVMLRFMYTDDLPGDEDLQPTTEVFQDLLAAADRYALDRLKLVCARKLWDDVSADSIGSTLACAETYNCQELKKKCIDFFADEKNFKKAVLTDGFVQLVQKFPSILAELRVRLGHS